MANDAERRRWNDSYWTSVWPHREQLTSAVTPYLLDHLAPSDGERILDVGSGGGTATLALAARTAQGSVVGADFSEALCALATERVHAAPSAAGRVSFVVADAQVEDIPGAPFDAAISQFGVMFFDEPVRAFAQIRRQVRPGGRLTFACWQGPECNPWSPGPGLVRFLPAPAPPPEGKSPTGPFSLADARATARILESAGWTAVGRHPYELVVRVGRDAIIDQDQLRFNGVAEEDLAAAWATLDAALAPLARPDGDYDAPISFQIFTASN